MFVNLPSGCTAPCSAMTTCRLLLVEAVTADEGQDCTRASVSAGRKARSSSPPLRWGDHGEAGAALGVFFVVCDDRCCARLSRRRLLVHACMRLLLRGWAFECAVSVTGAVRCGVVHSPASLKDAAVLSHQRPSYLPSREIAGSVGAGRESNKAQLQWTQDHPGHTQPGVSWVEDRRAQLKTKNVTFLLPGARTNSPPPPAHPANS